MHLVQLLLPVYDNDGVEIPASTFREVREVLTTRFGGLTAYTHAPAEGLWKDDAAQTTKDQIVIYEVMAERLDLDWWRDYRHELERRFKQETLVVRAHPLHLL